MIISSSFADIFRNNSLNNGLLVTEVPEDFLRQLFDTVTGDPAAEIKVDLAEQKVTNLKTGNSAEFQIRVQRIIDNV